MTIVWAHAESDRVFDAIEAVEQALEQQESAARHDDRYLGDSYLAENVELMRAAWSVDVWRVVATSGARLGRLVDAGQRTVRRLTWWHSLPQWQQVSEFNGATVRTTDALVSHIRALTAHLYALEATHSEPRLRAVESQLRAARDEQILLRRRVAELEKQLSGLREHMNDSSAA